jgi:hypothetical protein
LMAFSLSVPLERKPKSFEKTISPMTWNLSAIVSDSIVS